MAEETSSSTSSGGSSSVKLPVIGTVKKTYLYVGLAVVAGVVAYAWWQSSSTTDTTTPLPEGEEGFVTDDIGGGGGYYYTGGGGAASDTVVGSPISTNSEWTARAMEALEAAGWDSMAAAVALGKYLDKKPLSAAEVPMVQFALAAVGRPPEGGPYEILTGAGGDPPAPSGKPGKPTGVRAEYTGRDALGGKGTVFWNPVAGAVRYRVDVGTQRLEVPASMVAFTGTKRHVKGLKPGKQIALVVAVNAAGTESDRGGPAVINVPAPPPPPKKPAPKK